MKTQGQMAQAVVQVTTKQATPPKDKVEALIAGFKDQVFKLQGARNLKVLKRVCSILDKLAIVHKAQHHNVLWGVPSMQQWQSWGPGLSPPATPRASLPGPYT